MQILEVRVAVRTLWWSLGVKGLTLSTNTFEVIFKYLCVRLQKMAEFCRNMQHLTRNCVFVHVTDVHVLVLQKSNVATTQRITRIT
jgi:hypothetical protein